MVLKYGKRGVFSGNTLKTPSSQDLRDYRKNAYIMRYNTEDIGVDLTSETFGVDDIQTPNIPYSLNKKGRWLLPTQLMNAIKKGLFHFEEFGVQLIEKHNINKPANCVSAYFSKGPVRQATVLKQKGKRQRRGSGYISEQSLKSRNIPSANRKRRRQTNRSFPSEQDACMPSHAPASEQVTFEVVYPSPVTSSLTHNPKYIGIDRWKDCVPKQTSKHRKLRRTNREIIQFDLSVLNNENDLSDDDDVLEHYSGDLRNDAVDFQAYITHAINARKDNQKHAAKSDSFVTVPDLNEFELLETDDQPSRVILQHNDTDPVSLSSRYVGRYVECECFPRKFVIDVSDDVQSLPAFTASWKESFKPVHACVVFVYDVDNEINTAQDGVYKVYINTSFTSDMQSSKIETIFEYSETNIAECLSMSLFYAETLPGLVQPSENVQACSKFSTKHVFLDWNHDSYTPNDAFHYESFMSSCQQNNVHYVDHCLDKESISPSEHTHTSRPRGKLCTICFEEIGTRLPGTSVVKCGHWFCDICWKDYLTCRVQSGSVKIDCPEFSCKNPVDKATMLSLLDLDNIIKLSKKIHDSAVVRLDETQWCPNKKCGRVVQLKEPEITIVRCECGQRTCLKCLGQAHWPAPCNAMVQYDGVKNTLGITNDIIDPNIISVNGMSCPHCKQFFEKIDGCPYMECLCGNSFCWGCGRDWYTRFHGARCYEIGEQKVNMLTVHKFVFEQDLENGWVNAAISHYIDQGPGKVALKLNSQQKAKILATFLNKTYHDITLGFKGSKRGYTKESQKITEFLDHLIDIKSELHFVAENIAVLLSSVQSKSTPQISYLKHVYYRLNAKCKAIEECMLENVTLANALTIIRKLKSSHEASKRLIESIARHHKCLKL